MATPLVTTTTPVVDSTARNSEPYTPSEASTVVLTKKRKLGDMEADQLKASLSAVQRIDHDGDVILETETGEQLLVSSKALSLASKPFATMFSSDFLEGQSLSTTEPPIIVMEDDDPSALRTLLLIMHHREGFPAKRKHQEDLCFKLLVLAEKYDCARAIRSDVLLLLRRSMNGWYDITQVDSVEAFSLILNAFAAGYLLEDKELFDDAAHQLIFATRASDSFTWGLSGDITRLIPPALWMHCSEQRTLHRTELYGSLRRVMAETRSSYNKAFIDHRKLMADLGREDRYDLEWALTEHESRGSSIEEVTNLLRVDLDAVLAAVATEAPTMESRMSRAPTQLLAYRLSTRLTSFEDSRTTLCLDCALTARNNIPNIVGALTMSQPCHADIGIYETSSGCATTVASPSIDIPWGMFQSPRTRRNLRKRLESLPPDERQAVVNVEVQNQLEAKVQACFHRSNPEENGGRVNFGQPATADGRNPFAGLVPTRQRDGIGHETVHEGYQTWRRGQPAAGCTPGWPYFGLSPTTQSQRPAGQAVTTQGQQTPTGQTQDQQTLGQNRPAPAYPSGGLFGTSRPPTQGQQPAGQASSLFGPGPSGQSGMGLSTLGGTQGQQPSGQDW